MKKFLILLLCLFVGDSFATGISGNVSSAPCDNATLDKYTGTANVEINWEPNTINLTWYDGDMQLNVPVASQTCTYDSMITVPPAPPEKLGYTFNGWKIPKIDFSTIPTDVQGTNRWSVGWDNNANTNICWYAAATGDAWKVDCNSDSTYNELQPYEWKVKYNHGDLYGVAGCGTTSGTHAQHGNPTITNGSGQYCWCKATGYKIANTSVINSPSSVLSWVFGSATVGICARDCVAYCVNAADYISSFRRALFTPASN